MNKRSNQMKSEGSFEPREKTRSVDDSAESEKRSEQWSRGWSSVLLAAVNLSDAGSFKAAVGAALSSGWDLWAAIDTGDRGRLLFSESVPLPLLVASHWRSDREGVNGARTVALVEGLSALGVDWNRRWPEPAGEEAGRLRTAPLSPLQAAAQHKNWDACEAMVQNGGSWLRAERPCESPLALILSLPSYGGDEHLDQVQERCKKAAWAELEAACASGEADPEVWMPLALMAQLAEGDMLGASVGPASKAQARKSSEFWKYSFSRAVAAGCKKWNKPVEFGQRPPDWTRRFETGIEGSTLPLALARRALVQPEAWAAATKTPGFKVDSRSGWALGAGLVEELEAGQDFRSRLKWSKGALSRLRRLDPWREAFLASRDAPKLNAAAKKERVAIEPGGWGRAAAALIERESSSVYDEGSACGVALKGPQRLLRGLGELACELAAWSGAERGSPGAVSFEKEFGEQVGRAALNVDGVPSDFTMEAPRSDPRERVLADGPRVACEAIGQLLLAGHAGGRALALAATHGLADAVAGLLASSRPADVGFDEERCVAELCKLALETEWGDDLPDAATAWMKPVALAYKRALASGDEEAGSRAGQALAWTEARAIQAATGPALANKRPGARL